MNKVIIVTAYNRPAYTQRVLEALSRCGRLNDYRVMISIDAGCREIEEICRPWKPYDCLYWTNQIRLGVANNQRAAQTAAFQWYRADFVVALHDDAVLSPDALYLCDWFFEHGKDYTLLNLSNKNYENDEPLELVESVGVTSPWAIAFTREVWNQLIYPTWNGKIREPYGWDWSLTYQIVTQGLKTLAPKLARATNIGREGGTYETEQTYDNWTHGLVVSDGSVRGDFKITSRLPASYPEGYISEWMQREAK